MMTDQKGQAVRGFDLRKDAEFERLMTWYGMVKLGEGRSREVFGSPQVPFVVKRAHADRKVCNKTEATQYKRARSLGLTEYVARVWAVSETGRYLMMERVEPFSWSDYRTPELRKAADILGTWDTHPGNVGKRRDGTPVLIDLGHDGEHVWDEEE